MDRRDMLKRVPMLAALASVPAIDINDGKVKKFEPQPGHFIFVVDIDKVDVSSMEKMNGLMPPGATGGWIVGVFGNPDDAFKIYRLDKET